jgi:hypothetical protein
MLRYYYWLNGWTLYTVGSEVHPAVKNALLSLPVQRCSRQWQSIYAFIFANVYVVDPFIPNLLYLSQRVKAAIALIIVDSKGDPIRGPRRRWRTRPSHLPPMVSDWGRSSLSLSATSVGATLCQSSRWRSKTVPTMATCSIGLDRKVRFWGRFCLAFAHFLWL